VGFDPLIQKPRFDMLIDQKVLNDLYWFRLSCGGKKSCSFINHSILSVLGLIVTSFVKVDDFAHSVQSMKLICRVCTDLENWWNTNRAKKLKCRRNFRTPSALGDDKIKRFTV
jgi:hypothetical protein